MDILSKVFDIIFVVFFNLIKVVKNKWFYKPFLAVSLFIAVVMFFNYYTFIFPIEYIQWRNPLIRREVRVVEKNVLSPVVEQEEFTLEAIKSWTGYATTYSVVNNGCLGCAKYYDKDGLYHIMNNGDRLDDTKPTMALGKTFMKNEGIELNTEVRITNIETGESEFVKVTDTGNFDIEYSRLGDITLALRDILGCSDMCYVRVEIF